MFVPLDRSSFLINSQDIPDIKYYWLNTNIACGVLFLALMMKKKKVVNFLIKTIYKLDQSTAQMALSSWNQRERNFFLEQFLQTPENYLPSVLKENTF